MNRSILNLENKKQEPETAIFRQARPHYYDPFNPVQLPQFILPLSPSRFYFSKLNQQQNGFSTVTFPLKHLQSAIQLFFGLAKENKNLKASKRKKKRSWASKAADDDTGYIKSKT